jgi:tight adherence protein B
VAVVAVARLAWSTARHGVRRHESRLLRLATAELVELFVFLDPVAFLRLNAIVVLLAPPVVAWLAGSTLAGVALFVFLLVAPTLALRRLRRRRSRALLQQLPDAVRAIATGLRAGQGLSQAIEQVPRYQPRPISEEFALVLRQRRVGLPVEDALRSMAERSGLYEFHMLVATLSIAANLGGGVAEALDRLGDSVRRRVAMEARIEALTAQGRLQGRIVSALPLLIVLALCAIQPAAVRSLFLTPLGWCTLFVVAALELVGWLLIRRIVRIDV